MKIIVFDFDKTLINYDSLTRLLFIRMISWRFFLFPFYIVLKVLSKFSCISILKEKEIAFKLLMPNKYDEFDLVCKKYSKKIILNDIKLILDKEIGNNNRVIILTASPENYLKPLFPDADVIGLTFKIDEKNNIISINQHPYGKEKYDCLKALGINKVDSMYYDSKSDEYLIPLCNSWFKVKQGKVINEYYKK
jgi:phosphoserine phosphatase